MIALEDLTGKTFFEIIQDLQDLENVKISKIRDIIWAALIHEDKELTLEQTTDILDQGDCMDLVGKLMKAWENPRETLKRGRQRRTKRKTLLPHKRLFF